MRRVVHVTLGTAWTDLHLALRGIDMHAFHRRQVDDEAIVATAQTRPVMTTAAHRQQQAVLAGDLHGGHDVGDVHAARCRTAPRRTVLIEVAQPPYAASV